jgi:hypothetical protein
MSALILRPSPIGEMAHQIDVTEADSLVEQGKAVKLEHLIYKEVAVNEYETKVMEPVKKVIRKTKAALANEGDA